MNLHNSASLSHVGVAGTSLLTPRQYAGTTTFTSENVAPTRDETASMRNPDVPKHLLTIRKLPLAVLEAIEHKFLYSISQTPVVPEAR
eukprot:1635927-Amphidinium_carterae.1